MTMRRIQIDIIIICLCRVLYTALRHVDSTSSHRFYAHPFGIWPALCTFTFVGHRQGHRAKQSCLPVCNQCTSSPAMSRFQQTYCAMSSCGVSEHSSRPFLDQTLYNHCVMPSCGVSMRNDIMWRVRTLFLTIPGSNSMWTCRYIGREGHCLSRSCDTTHKRLKAIA